MTSAKLAFPTSRSAVFASQRSSSPAGCGSTRLSSTSRRRSTAAQPSSAPPDHARRRRQSSTAAPFMSGTSGDLGPRRSSNRRQSVALAKSTSNVAAGQLPPASRQIQRVTDDVILRRRSSLAAFVPSSDESLSTRASRQRRSSTVQRPTSETSRTEASRTSTAAARQQTTTESSVRLPDRLIKQLYATLMITDGDSANDGDNDDVFSVDSSSSADASRFSSDASACWKQTWSVDSNGSKPGSVRSIRDICFCGDQRLAVTEEKNARVQILSASQTGCRYVRILDAPQTNRSTTSRQFQPGGICMVRGVGLADDLDWLAVTDVDRVVILDVGGNESRSDALKVKFKVDLFGIDVTDRGRLLLTDLGARPSVGLHDLATGQLVRDFAGADFDKPLYVTTSTEYQLTFVSDCQQRCVYVFDRDGQVFLTTISGATTGADQLVYPAGVRSVDAGRRLLIADSVENRVLAYDLRSRRFEQLLTSEMHGLRHPGCMASDGTRLAVVEEFNDMKAEHCQLKMFTYRK